MKSLYNYIKESLLDNEEKIVNNDFGSKKEIIDELNIIIDDPASFTNNRYNFLYNAFNIYGYKVDIDSIDIKKHHYIGISKKLADDKDLYIFINDEYRHEFDGYIHVFNSKFDWLSDYIDLDKDDIIDKIDEDNLDVFMVDDIFNKVNYKKLCKTQNNYIEENY